MVHLRLSVILVICASSISSTKVYEGTTKELKDARSSVEGDPLAEHNDFHCDLNLMPSQKKLMYYEYRLQRKESSYDMYKWPKNKEGSVIVPYRISHTSLFSK